MFYHDNNSDIIRLVVADSDQNWRERLRKIFDAHPVVRVTGVAGTGEQCIRLVRDLVPDAVLMDYALGDMDGLTVAEHVAKVAPGTVIIMYSDHPSQELAKRSASLVQKLIRRPLSLQDAAGPVEFEVAEMRRRAREAEELPRIEPGAGPLRRFGKRSEVSEKAVAVPRTAILVCSPKGGVGKTSVVVNMACAAATQAMFKPRVAVVDLNEFGCVTTQMNLGSPNPDEALMEGRVPKNILMWREVEGEVTPDDLPYLMAQHPTSGVWVVPSVPSPEQLEEVTPELIHKVVNTLKREFDLVIIDAPPSVNLHTTWVSATEAQKILVILRPDIQAIPGLNQLRRVFEHPQLSVSQRCYRVVNQHDMPYGMSLKDIDYYAPWPCAGMIPDTPEIMQFILRGEPYVLARPQSPYAVAIRAVLNEFFPAFTGELLKEPPKEKRRLGFFGRLLARR